MHRQRLRGAPRSICVCLTTLAICLPVGCGTDAIPGSDTSSTTRSDPGQETETVASSQDATPEVASGSSNVFPSAEPATMPAIGTITINGAISSSGDVNLYMLGSAVAGDRIVIEVTGHNGLNTVAALFDGYGDLIDANDDRSYYAGLVDPYIARVIREDTSNLYLGIAVPSAVHFASPSGRYETGSYSIRVDREVSAAVAEPQRQVVYLDFAGGDSVQIGLEPIEVMQPFSTAAISSRLAGDREYIIGLLVDHMRQDFAAHDVVLVDGRYNADPTEPHSTLFFGNYNANYLGLADNVDTGNAYLEQEAIIYSDDLALFESLQPSAEEIALALANIASHEMGHLLGLEHSAEAGDLMATAATAQQILEINAAFDRTLLLDSVFPTGWQNGTHLLQLNVGPNPSGSSGARLRLTDFMPKPSTAWRDALPDIPIVQCGRCNKCAHEP